MTIHIAVIPTGGEPYLKEIEGEQRKDGSISYLTAFQEEVNGLVEFLDPPFGDSPALLVNEDFLSNNSAPNRAIYANRRIHDMGYLDTLTYSHVPEIGELYGLVFGTFIAVSYDRDGNAQDMPADEWEKVYSTFGGVRSIFSGMVELTRIRANRCTEHIKVNMPDNAEGYERGNGEGVFVLVDEQTKRAHDNDEESGIYFGVLDNDSFYWPGINHGEIIPFEMRGNNRPVVPLAWLVESYGAILGAEQ